MKWIRWILFFMALLAAGLLATGLFLGILAGACIGIFFMGLEAAIKAFMDQKSAEIQQRAITISRTTTATVAEASDALVAVLEAGGTLDAAEAAVRTAIALADCGVPSVGEAMRRFGVSAQEAAASLTEIGRRLDGGTALNELRQSIGCRLEGDQVVVGPARLVNAHKAKPVQSPQELPPIEEPATRRIILQEEGKDD